MKNKIKKVYVVHHSHTDIGYTDLQERVVLDQVDYIRAALELLRKPENQSFRWNCETWFCVREFLKRASTEERTEFFDRMRQQQLGFSANYLNFNDLADLDALTSLMDEMTTLLDHENIAHETAMFADINGISMGQRDAMLDHGVQFLYTNIHTHHGMYPLYQNQNAYFWEDASGRRLLVWNGEHYNLGNALGICPDEEYIAKVARETGKQPDPVELLRQKLTDYLEDCHTHDYPYDFIVISVSGVFSDNAPPSDAILRVIEGYNQSTSDVQLQMVSLQELYHLIAPELTNVPVYRGDLTDWWAHGIGADPYGLKHYRDAQHKYHLCKRLDANISKTYPELAQITQDNLLLYAEHTYGHSSTITNPYDSLVLHLYMRKSSYASKAHEAASLMLTEICAQKGDILRYYDRNGILRVCATNRQPGLQPVEFYIARDIIPNLSIIREDGKQMTCQISKHSRGVLISFMDDFDESGEHTYRFCEAPAKVQPSTKRYGYIGAELVKDVINTYDSTSCHLPYEFENTWFHLCYRPGLGITRFVNKKTGQDLLCSGLTPFFTPIYEQTKIRWEDAPNFSDACYRERRILGRNIRGKHAKIHQAILEKVDCVERGEIFTVLKLTYTLPGTVHCCVFLKFYEQAPLIDFRMEIGKTLNYDIESILLPMTLQVDDQQSLYLEKGGCEAFRPGIDQIPGTCMEYYVSDNGLAFVGQTSSILIASYDAPLFYMGELAHHPIQLCDQKDDNNRRPIYSWVMNNIWETNFKMDLSGFLEFRYRLYLCDDSNPQTVMDTLRDLTFDPYPFIIG